MIRVLALSLFTVGLMLAAVSSSGVAYAANPPGLVPEDLDHDGDVDLDDFGLFQACMSRSGIPHNGSPTCQEADIDYDGDVDMSDFGVLQVCYSGPGTMANPACGCVRPKADRAVGAGLNPIISGQATYITVAASQVGVNYQLRIDPANTNVGSPVTGTGDIISLPTGPLTTATTFNMLAINAAAGCSVELTATQTITIAVSSSKNKLGVHVVWGSRNGYGPFLETCASVPDKRVAVVKCVDDFSPGGEAKHYSSDTLTIGRKNDLPSCSWGSNCDLQGFDAVAESGTPPAVHAQRVFNDLRPIWEANTSRIDVWEICNEWSAWWAWQADFYIAMMDLAEAHNPPFRIALYGCSVGNPPESSWPDIARACARAKAHGNHILSLHEYGFWADLLQDSYAQFGDDLVLRYRRLYNYLIPRNADCPLALTEVGQGNGCCFVGTGLFVQDFGWYDAQLRQDYYVIGCAAWTLGNWAGANFQDALPSLAQYIITH